MDLTWLEAVTSLRQYHAAIVKWGCQPRSGGHIKKCGVVYRVGFGRVQNLFLPGQWKKLEETCFFQFWTGFVRPSGRNLSKTWTKPISTI